MAEPTGRYASLARHLETLASETRLELLHALRTPKAIQDLRVGPSMMREGEQADRSISRQAIARHLEQLQRAGLIHRTVAATPNRADAYVLNHERLFAMVDELRGLTRLRPTLSTDALASETMDGEGVHGQALQGPRLMVVFGRDEGAGFSLQGAAGKTWRIGRAAECEIRLDYDPFLSQTNTIVERAREGFVVRDERSRNGTWVNWVRMPKGGSKPLSPGDVLTVGRSSLVFQP
ncbi:MAG TPA: FHA domain-containing protein [Candidatus Thermoplasmatota archaeon]|nr:FHA domain-containing protein [Candidatus Thermoplasmatota archaeon]